MKRKKLFVEASFLLLKTFILAKICDILRINKI
jgi:hypothetical protein